MLFFRKPKINDTVHELTLLRTGCMRRRRYNVVDVRRKHVVLAQDFKTENETVLKSKLIWNKHHKKWYLRRFA